MSLGALSDSRLAEWMIELNRKLQKAREVMSSPGDIDIGSTPADVVYREDKLKLLHYRPMVEKTHPTPILIAYALVNRHNILDLQPDRSVVGSLLRQGFDVYNIDWGYPTQADKYLTIDDYVNRYIDNVVDVVRERSKVDKISLFGYCMGGTFTVIYTVLHPEKVKNLIVGVAPINFDTTQGILHIWAKSLDVDKVVDTFGNVPGQFLNIGFLLLNPMRIALDKYVGFVENVEDEEFVKNFLRMEKWVNDSPDVAGEMYRQFIKDGYQKNLLVKNQMEIGGKRIDLRRIEVPLLNVFAEMDHIVPPESSRPLNGLVSSKDNAIFSFPTGHIGLAVSKKSQKDIWPKVGEWIKARSY